MTSENSLLVVNHPREFPWAITGATVISAREYLAGTAHFEGRRAHVINLCRHDRYQSRGYYVSLLAEARGQRPLPDMKSVGDLQSTSHPTGFSRPEFVAALQSLLHDQTGNEFTIDVIFGRDLARRRDELAQRIFQSLPAPLLRVSFEKVHGGWRTSRVQVLGLMDLNRAEREFVAAAVNSYLHQRPSRPRNCSAGMPALAILYNEDEPDPPSNVEALNCFIRLANSRGLRAEIIGRGDRDRLAEFDGLFIRDTTRVNHYTYEMARAAADAGLVVIDDPDSIVRCTNKVFLNELFVRHRVPIPKTVMVDPRTNAETVVEQLGLPCVVKRPDSAFSLGVFKVETIDTLEDALASLLGQSELVLAQEWFPTSFDWRVGVLDRRALYVCKYFMAPGHWQVVKREPQRKLEGSTETVAVGEAPEAVVKTAVRAANLIGDGLYGVDLKEVDGKCYVMEVNDNPNIDAGNEDAVLKDALYREIIGVFLRRIGEPARPHNGHDEARTGNWQNGMAIKYEGGEIAAQDSEGSDSRRIPV